jgi:hypothetical protein
MDGIEHQKKRMREIRAQLHAKAREVSEIFQGAPVVIVVGGSTQHNVPATVAGWANMTQEREARFRDVIGVLQSAVQIESFWHYMEDELFQDLKDKTDGTRIWSSIAEEGG